MFNDDFFDLLCGTEIYDRISGINKIYEKLESAQKVFESRLGIECKHGCGECCRHFLPDLTDAEAEYLGAGLILENRADEVLKTVTNRADIGYCPLYNDENDHHCTVYKWRPLICRLFGSSATRDKNGELVYGNCRWNENFHTISSAELVKAGEDAVIMSDYGIMLEEVSIENTATLPLPEALAKAIDKIEYILSLEKESER